MDSRPNELSAKRMQLALAFEAYKTDAVRIVNRDLRGFSHLVSTRRGLFAVNEHSHLLLAQGFFFGVTLRDGSIYAFEACDLPRGPTRQGRLVKLTREGDFLTEARVIAKALDNGCHQVDFVEDRLLVVDTYNQQIVRFAADFSEREVLAPLPLCPNGRWTPGDPAYMHVNSVLAVGDLILLLLHNSSAHTGRPSEIAVYDRNWRPLERWPLEGASCHGLALLEDGTVLTCGSDAGEVISAGGMHVEVSPLLTRGLAVGMDSVVVGASRLAQREERMVSTGTVTFMDRGYNISSVLELPAAPMEVRRLDGLDFGLSDYLRQLAWSSRLKVGPCVDDAVNMRARIDGASDVVSPSREPG